MNTKISLSDVRLALLQAVLEAGQADMAAVLDVAVSTLSNKLNVYPGQDHRHRLNIEDFDSLLQATEDFRPLELLAAKHGFLLIPAEAIPDKNSLAGEGMQDFQALAAFHAADGKDKTVYAVNALMREIFETFIFKMGEK